MRSAMGICAVALLVLLVWFLTRPVFAVTPVPVDLQIALRQDERWKEDCPVDWDRLRRVQVRFIDFAGSTQRGELIVLDAIAPAVRELFQALYRQHFPLQTVVPVLAARQADDPTLSVTSAYFCRPIRGSTTGAFSLHSYGTALDLNARENPFVGVKDAASGIMEVMPKQGIPFLNRANQRPGMVEPIVALVQRSGLSVWGGTWNQPIDYMHFEVPGTVTHLLVALPPPQALVLFALHRQYPEALVHIPYGPERDVLIALAQRAPDTFIEALRAVVPTAATLAPTQVVAQVRAAMKVR